MDIENIFKQAKTIAIVGLSNNEAKPSYQVGKYLKGKDFRIIPVNPMISEVFNIPSYPNISSVPKEIKIDIVDIFRKSDQIMPIIKEIIESGRRPIIWMQEDVICEEAKQLAKDNGMEVVMGICIMKIHQKK